MTLKFCCKASDWTEQEEQLFGDETKFIKNYATIDSGEVFISVYEVDSIENNLK